MKLDAFKSKWGVKPAGAPPAPKPRPSLGAPLHKPEGSVAYAERPGDMANEFEPVVSSSAEHAPVETSAAEYDGIPLSLVLERHLKRLTAKGGA